MIQENQLAQIVGWKCSCYIHILLVDRLSSSARRVNSIEEKPTERRDGREEMETTFANAAINW